MIIDTNKNYKPSEIWDFMSDLIACRLSDGYKIDFEQEFVIRNCYAIDREIGESYVVVTNNLESVLTYIVGDLDDPTQNVAFIAERHFNPKDIDDDTFSSSEEVQVAKFKLNQDGTYRLEGIRFNL